MIICVCGKPNKTDMEFITNEHAAKYIESLPTKEKLAIPKLLKYLNPKAIDLLEKMIVLNPKNRISLVDVMKHPYLASYFDPKNLSNTFQGTIDFSFEDNLTLHYNRFPPS